MLLYKKIHSSLINVSDDLRDRDFYEANTILTLETADQLSLFTEKNICYVIINKILNKVYIGASKEPFHSRYSFGFQTEALGWAAVSSCKQLKDDVLNYGLDNFCVSLLFSYNKSTKFNFWFEAVWINSLVNNKYIKLYNTIIPLLYNFDLGNGSFMTNGVYEQQIKNICQEKSLGKMEVLNVFFKRNAKNHKIPFVKLKCLECGGLSEKSVDNLKLGKLCNICRFKLKRTMFETFCLTAKKKFNNEYEYEFLKHDLKRIKVICKKCNQKTIQLRGRHLKNGCSFCASVSGKLNLMRPIAKIHPKTGEIIDVYPSVEAAAKSVGISSGNIPTVCSGKRNRTGGFKWKYI